MEVVKANGQVMTGYH